MKTQDQAPVSHVVTLVVTTTDFVIAGLNGQLLSHSPAEDSDAVQNTAEAVARALGITVRMVPNYPVPSEWTPQEIIDSLSELGTSDSVPDKKEPLSDLASEIAGYLRPSWPGVFNKNPDETEHLAKGLANHLSEQGWSQFYP